MTKGNDISLLDAIAIILKRAKKPLTVNEILNRLNKRQQYSITGKTPLNTINSRLSVDIKKYQRDSRFRRVSPGKFVFRKYQGDHTYLKATEIVLLEKNAPLGGKEIIEEIIKFDLRKIPPKNEIKILNARLSVDIKEKKEESIFKRVARGKYALRNYEREEYISKPHRKQIKHSTKIIVFEQKLLENLGYFHGIRKDIDYFSGKILNFNNTKTMIRLDAEKDFLHKQIVSYVIIRHQKQLLRFTRGMISSVGKYFFGQYSIGFGGHLEIDDWNLWSAHQADLGYCNSVKRELKEEIGIDISQQKIKDSLVGVLNDHSTDLGKQHFAFIHIIDILKKEVIKGEKSINELQFVNFTEIAEEFGGYEYWSKLCIQTFFGSELNFDSYVDVKPNFKLGGKRHVLITGHIGSGKSEACKILNDKFGYTLIPCSKILLNILGYQTMDDIGREKLQELGFKFISNLDGHRKYAEEIVNFIKSSDGNKFIFDGLRYLETINEIKKILNSKISIIYIESTIDSLFKNYKKKENDKDIKFGRFLKIVNHPVERDIEKFYPIADITIYNHGSLESYLKAINNFLEKEIL